MMYRYLFLLLFLPQWSLAQTTGTCSPGTASKDLDVNNVRARLYNTGGLFWKGAGNIYTVPKEAQANAIFAHNLWIAGMVDGALRITASDYGPWEWWPGPLDSLGYPPLDCADYDRMYKVSREDFKVYDETGEATEDLTEWPVHLGAPVQDGDGDPENYDLQRGDRPLLFGDQMVWWVMNDRGNEHGWSLSEPIGLEMQVTAFSFKGGPYTSPVDPVLAHTTFYRYRLIYKGRAPWEDAYFGLWNDPDLGDAGDDYVGSDSTLHMGYVWNGDDFDGSGGGYGDKPPALGNVILQGPTIDPDGLDNDRDGIVDEQGERQGMSSFIYYNSDATVQGNPDSGDDAYRFLRALWRDDFSVTYGGSGRGFSEEPTRFMFSGNPPAFWSEENTDNAGSRNTPADRRFIMATGPFRMEPGDIQDILVGIVWAQGQDRYRSVYKLKADVAGLHIFNSTAQCLIPEEQPAFLAAPAPPEPPDRYILYRNYPNPFATRTTIQYDLPQDQPVHLAVYDVLGRPIRTLVDAHQSAGSYAFDFDATGLSPGFYLARLRLGYLERTLRMIRHP